MAQLGEATTNQLIGVVAAGAEHRGNLFWGLTREIVHNYHSSLICRQVQETVVEVVQCFGSRDFICDRSLASQVLCPSTSFGRTLCMAADEARNPLQPRRE